MHELDASLKKRQALIHLRAALRHGDGVLTRRIHPAAFVAYLKAIEARQVAEASRQAASSGGAWDRALRRSALATDAARAGAVVFGVAGAVMLTGETLTLSASLMIVVLPAVLFVVRDVALSAQLQALQVDARRVQSQRAVVDARRRWLRAADALAALLLRSVRCSVALYEHERFRRIMHFTRRSATDQLLLDDLKDALTRAGNVERIVSRPAPRNLPSLAAILRQGWRSGVIVMRRAVAIAAGVALTYALFSVQAGRATDALVAGLICSALLGVRTMVSAREVELVRRAVAREALRMQYPGLVETVDERIAAGIESLLDQYAKGIDFEVIDDEDIETQLRILLDQRIAAISRTQVATDLVDLDTDESTHRNN